MLGEARGLPVTGGAGDATRGKVLVLDDDATARARVGAALAASHDVRTAGSVGDAWVALEQEPLDVVVADQELGAASGVEFLRELSVRQPKVGRILLARAATPGAREEAARSGAEGLALVFYDADPAELVSWVGNGVAMARLARARARFHS